MNCKNRLIGLSLSSLVRASVALAATCAVIPCQAAVAPAADVGTVAEWSATMNLAGRQRMLSQKMAKECLLVKLGVDVDANRKNLQGTISLFEKTLQGLQEGDASQKLVKTPNALIQKQLSAIAEAFAAYKEVLTPATTGTIDDKAVGVVAERSVAVLGAMDKACKMYERTARETLGGGSNIVINLAGKQRMLSQKMSKEFLLVAAGSNVEVNVVNLRETATLFDRTLTGLIAGDTDLELPACTNTEISAQLEVVKGIWAQFKPAIERGYSGKVGTEDIANVANLNPKLLAEMNKAVSMFEKAAADAKPAAVSSAEGK